jgi:hypothetical protein
MLIELEGIKTHNAIAATTISSPTGRRNALIRVRGWLRRVYMRRLVIGFTAFSGTRD